MKERTGEATLQLDEEKLIKLIELLNSKGFDGEQVIEELFNEAQNIKKIPTSS